MQERAVGVPRVPNRYLSWGLLAAVALVAGGTAATVRCGFSEDRQHRRALDSLVERGATRSDVARELGDKYVLYAKGTPSWSDLEGFLQREPEATLGPLREAVHRYPRVMYYTTAWRMTWIFLDDKDVIRNYYLAAQ